MTRKQPRKTEVSGVRTVECKYCGHEFSYEQKTGRGPSYCSLICRKARDNARTNARPQCRIDGCDNKAVYSDGICNACYTRRYRTGTLERRVYKYRSVTSHGYIVLVGRDDHPMSVRGRMYEHRQVLYDAIGPGPHVCHWCSASVNWVKGLCTKGSLVPDHLDGNKANNTRTNLVPACQQCNAARGLFMSWVRKHEDDPLLWQMYEASKRSA
jgi:hypothetical protein